MTSLGLAGFIAMIGLGAGPHFIDALREAGVGLFFGGVVVTLGAAAGRPVLRPRGAEAATGAAARRHRRRADDGRGLSRPCRRSPGSPVAVLGYSATVAIGHILLTTWGTVIVRLVT